MTVSVYLTNDLIGGYSIKPNRFVTEAASFVPAREIIRMAKQHKVKIHLAGGFWEKYGKKGWGETVPPEEAEKLIGE